MRSVLYLIICLVAFFVLSASPVLSQELPENLEEMTQQGDEKIFYLEEDDKIEIYTCSILTLEKVRKNESGEEEPLKEPEKTTEESEFTFSRGNIEETDEEDVPEVSSRDDVVTGRVLEEEQDFSEDESISEKQELDEGCDPSWFCDKWVSCFRDKEECYVVARNNECDYNKLYPLIVECGSEENETSQPVKDESVLENRRSFSWGIIAVVAGVPLLGLFVADRYLRHKKTLEKKRDEERKIEDIKRKYGGM